jgi:hypothetical protein
MLSFGSTEARSDLVQVSISLSSDVKSVHLLDCWRIEKRWSVRMLLKYYKAHYVLKKRILQASMRIE